MMRKFIILAVLVLVLFIGLALETVEAQKTYYRGDYWYVTTGTLYYWGFRSQAANRHHVFLRSQEGYYSYCWAAAAPGNVAGKYIQIVQMLGGVVVREIRLWPGGSFSDHVACDSFIVVLTAGDTLQLGGHY